MRVVGGHYATLSSATISTVQRQPSPGKAGGVVNEIEKRVEGEPGGHGSSELCGGTAVVGSVGGLRGNEKLIQLSVGDSSSTTRAVRAVR